MNKIVFCLVFLITLFVSGCEKENDRFTGQDNFCSAFANLLIEKETEQDVKEINGLLESAPLSLTSSNTSQQRANYENLLKAIQSCPDLQVISSCYECIYTLPAQTEIRIELKEKGRKVQKCIDLQLKNNKLQIVAIHD